MKALDDITRIEFDAMYDDEDFAFDSRPLVAGEPGAGTFPCEPHGVISWCTVCDG